MMMTSIFKETLMDNLIGYGPDCCGPDDSAFGPDKAAGGSQEPRSPAPPTQPTASGPEARNGAVSAKEHNFVSVLGKMARVWEGLDGEIYFREDLEASTSAAWSRVQGAEILRLAGLVDSLAATLAAIQCHEKLNMRMLATRTGFDLTDIPAPLWMPRLEEALRAAGRLS